MSLKEDKPVSELNALLAALRQAPADEQLHWHGKKKLDMLSLNTPSFFTAYQPAIDELLQILFSGTAVRHQQLSRLAATQLKYKYTIDAQTDPATEKSLLSCLAHDALFLALLEKTYNCDLELESFLRKMRVFLLLTHRAGYAFSQQEVRLTVALAQQCFNNEYIFPEEEKEEEEQAIIHALTEEFAHWITGRTGKDLEVPLFVLAMYRPLALLPWADRLAALPLEIFSYPARQAIRSLLHEPLEEQRLAQMLPTFGSIRDLTSQSVRTQYEAHPYPRWLNLGGPFSSVANTLTKIKPGFTWPVARGDGPLQILVAGCGTGLELLPIAAGNPHAEIVAIDLSRASLAYAKRMANRYALHNVTFLQGDILELSALNRSFQHISCAGVLHHLKDPVAGWRALAQVLHPGGTLNVAVYSRVARLPIEALRRDIKRFGLQPTPAEMKQFRSQFLTTDTYKRIHTYLPDSDMYCLSMFRDMLFHVHEHGYLLAEIRDIIHALGLSFLGFRLFTPSLRATYRERFPHAPRMNSFTHWMQFERHYAGRSEMLSCWLQKPSSVQSESAS